jgi:hypothetical protein
VADPGCLSRIPDPDFYPSKNSNIREEYQKNYRTFYSKKLPLTLKSMGLGSGIRKKPIPDPVVKKAPDPGSGSTTMSGS